MFVPHLSPILGQVFHFWLRQRGLAPYLVPNKVPNVFPWGPWVLFWQFLGRNGQARKAPQFGSALIRITWRPPWIPWQNKKTQSNTRSILMILLLDLRDLCFFLFLCFRFFSFYLILLVQNSCVSSLLVRSPHCLPRSNQITQQLSYTREAEGSWGSKLSENTQHLIIGHATRTIFIAGLMWLVMSIKM